MDNLESIKYKEYGDGWYCKIDIKTNERMSFKNGVGSGTGLYNEMLEWADSGEKIDPLYTPEELREKKMQDLENAKASLRSERDKRLKEADLWELPSIIKRFLLTTEYILEYKQLLLDIPQTHTTLEQMQNPEWPKKLIDEELV